MPGHCFREVLSPVVLGEMRPCSELHGAPSFLSYGPFPYYVPVVSSLSHQLKNSFLLPPPFTTQGRFSAARLLPCQERSRPSQRPFSEITKGRLVVRASNGSAGCFLASEHPRLHPLLDLLSPKYVCQGGAGSRGVLSLGWGAEDHYLVCGWDSERQGEISGCALSHLQSTGLPNQKHVKKK